MNYLKKLSHRSLKTFYDLIRIMLPVMILVRIGEQFELSRSLGLILGPVMELVGLPPEAGLVWAVTMLTGLYGGVGAYLGLISDLNMSVGQHSVLCAMMLFAHSIPVEQAIVRRAGASFFLTTGLRILAALVYGAGVAWICSTTNSLSQPLEPTWLTSGLTVGLASPDWFAWAAATGMTLLTMFGIIIVLFILLDGLETAGFINWITRVMAPALSALGIDPRLAPLVTVGMVLGLTYGGGLIINATREAQYSKRALFLALGFLSISHAIIEDTAMMLALGADIRVILFGKLAFTLGLIVMLAFILEGVERRRTRARS